MTTGYTPAEQLAALEACIAAMSRRTPRHPGPFCGCVTCAEETDHLEGKAEARKDAREWASGREGDRAADLYYGDAR